MKRIIALVLLAILMTGCGASEKSYDEEPMDSTETVVEVIREVEVPAESGFDYVTGTGDEDATGAPLNNNLPGLEQRKIVYRATLHADSYDLDAFHDLVTTQLGTHFGYIENEAATEKRLEMTLRVPSESLDDFLDALKQGGEVTYFTKTSEDITNTYTTYEARKLALEARHQRLIELIEVAETVEDIIELERERSEVEAELTEIGIRLTSFDSLVDYSTVYLKVDYVDIELINQLPTAELPRVYTQERDKNSYEFRIMNNDEELTVDLEVKIYDQEELIYEDTFTVLPLYDEFVKITGLKSDTTYRMEYTASIEDHEDSRTEVTTFSTTESFGDRIVNAFEDTWFGTVSGVQGFILVLIRLIPFAIIGGVLFFPIRFFVRKNNEKREEIRKEKEETDRK